MHDFFHSPGHDSTARWAPLLLRLIVGYGFVQHGLAKLLRGSDAFATVLQAIGVPAPHLFAWVTILIEILGGFAVLAGAFVRLASLPLAAVLSVAIFTVHLPYGFSSVKLLAVTPTGARFGPVGYETNLLYLACLGSLLLSGPGAFAIDNLKKSSASRQTELALDESDQMLPSRKHDRRFHVQRR
jgi:putative oxidoreductase